MDKVYLDGPLKGCTETEFEAHRLLDCRVALALGWMKTPDYEAGGTGWYQYELGPVSGRDDDDGIPYFSADMNGAHRAFTHMAYAWGYVARQKFWEFLQKRANLDPVVFTLPEYPDALIALADRLPEHICHAFADTFEYHQKAGLDPCQQSKRASDFVDDQIERREFTDYDADGNMVKRFNPIPKKTPWIENVLTVPDDYDVTRAENHADVQRADKVVTVSGKVLKHRDRIGSLS